MAKIYMVEVGVELNNDHDEYHFYECNVNGVKRGLFDENIVAFQDEQDALDFIEMYVKNGVKNTYGVMWNVERELNDYEIKDFEEFKVLDDEFLPRAIDKVYFKGGVS